MKIEKIQKKFRKIWKQKKTQRIKKKMIRVLVLTMEVAAVTIILYIITLPFYPNIIYEFKHDEPLMYEEAKDEIIVREKTREIINNLPQAEDEIVGNRVIITKIGVNVPIIESQNSEYGLSKGAWRVPESSTPIQGSNTVITGHRFKYLPPSNLTFYLFHKLEKGDIVSIVWDEEEYYYRIREIKIVAPHDFSILEPTDEPILTMFTCHPIYSEESRLVVISELIPTDVGEKELEGQEVVPEAREE